MPCQVLLKLTDDLVTRFPCQTVDFEETRVAINSNKVILLIQLKKVAGDF